VKQAKRSSRRDYADKLFRFYIRDRDQICQMATVDPTCDGSLECAHFVGRRIYSVRWHPSNAALLCQKHHRELDGDPIGRDSWFQTRLGEDRLRELHRLSREPWHRDYSRVLADIKRLAQKGDSAHG
jgi:hypothetical protein